MMPPPNNRPLRLAFTDKNNPGWVASFYYLKNLFIALKSLDEDQRPTLILLVPSRARTDNDNNLYSLVDQLLQIPDSSPPPIWKRLVDRIRRDIMFLPAPESPLGLYLRQHEVDSLFSSTQYGSLFKVPLLAWIPDFQHLYFPEMFSPERIEHRNWHFSQIAVHATRVILSSQQACHDFNNFAPEAAHKARVLSFVAQVPVHIYDNDPGWVCDYYHLPERFIYLPNQFWKHKNHQQVIEALTFVKSKYPEITVVCSGNPIEYRDPLYFAKMLVSISERGLRDRFILLGFIPHDHLFSLMRQSLAVLQPSLFEGWSTTVEEVKSLGKTIILSDIIVHREQNPPAAIYFDPYDPESLANSLIQVFAEKNPGPDYELEALARQQLSERTRRFGQTYLDITKEVVSF